MGSRVDRKIANYIFSNATKEQRLPSKDIKYNQRLPQMGFHDHAETLKKLDEQFYIDTHRYLILNMLRSKRKLFFFFKNIRIFVVWASIPPLSPQWTFSRFVTLSMTSKKILQELSGHAKQAKCYNSNFLEENNTTVTFLKRIIGFFSILVNATLVRC